MRCEENGRNHFWSGLGVEFKFTQGNSKIILMSRSDENLALGTDFNGIEKWRGENRQYRIS